MNNVLIFSLRFLLFALLVVFNTIIIIVAAWNFCVLQESSIYRPIDAYLIFLGAFTVLFMLPVIFIDAIRKGAITSLVWFELTWVSILWILELAGAAALSATGADSSCMADASRALANTCTSYHLLLAFTWLAMFTLLILLVGLLTSVLAHNSQFPHVWTTGVRDFPWFEHRHQAPSAAFLENSGGKTRIQPPPGGRYSSRHDQRATQPTPYTYATNTNTNTNTNVNTNARRTSQPKANRTSNPQYAYAFASRDAAMGSGSNQPAALVVEPIYRQSANVNPYGRGPSAQIPIITPPSRVQHREAQDSAPVAAEFYPGFIQSTRPVGRSSPANANANGIRSTPTPAQMVILEATKLSRTREERAAEFAKQQAVEVRRPLPAPMGPRSKPRPPRLIL